MDGGTAPAMSIWKKEPLVVQARGARLVSIVKSRIQHGQDVFSRGIGLNIMNSGDNIAPAAPHHTEHLQGFLLNLSGGSFGEDALGINTAPKYNSVAIFLFQIDIGLHGNRCAIRPPKSIGT